MALADLNERKIWNYLKSKGLNDYGCAGLLGNLFAESGLNPKNLQNTYERSLGFTDDEYVYAVDNKTYTNFIYDAAGFGLAQWTYWSRKKALYDYAKSKNKSIGDLEMQLEFLYKELSQNYPSVLNALKTATSVLEASNVILFKFERPADQSVSMQNKRASYGQKYYNKYAISGSVESGDVMGYKTCTKGKEVKLSSNFKSTEFDCHGNGCCSKTLINVNLIEYLQKIRNHFGKSITITSGYRCSAHNKNIGGATGSRHAKGDAVDIVVDGVAPKEVAKYAESIGVKGIGLYETSADGYFVHIDTRTSKSFWYGQSQKYVSTFGGGGSASSTKPDRIDTIKDVQNWAKANYKSNIIADGIYGGKTKRALVKILQTEINRAYKTNLKVDGIWGKETESVCPMLKAGVKNDIVSVLQALLICNKIINVYVDGHYGSATTNAVKSYQKKNGLVMDGVAGKETFAKLCS